MACGSVCTFRQRHVRWSSRYTHWYWDGEERSAEQVRRLSEDDYSTVNDAVDSELEENRKKDWQTDECPEDGNCPCDDFVVWRGTLRWYTMEKESGKAKVTHKFQWRWRRHSGYCDEDWETIAFYAPDVEQRRQAKV